MYCDSYQPKQQMWYFLSVNSEAPAFCGAKFLPWVPAFPLGHKQATQLLLSSWSTTHNFVTPHLCHQSAPILYVCSDYKTVQVFPIPAEFGGYVSYTRAYSIQFKKKVGIPSGAYSSVSPIAVTLSCLSNEILNEVEERIMDSKAPSAPCEGNWGSRLCPNE